MDRVTAPRNSLLDAALVVLSDARGPMPCGPILDEIERRGLWRSPRGRTPEATLYAALFRESRRADRPPRVVRYERGVFALRR